MILDQLEDGAVLETEVHWYEGHGIVKKYSGQAGMTGIQKKGNPAAKLQGWQIKEFQFVDISGEFRKFSGYILLDV